MGIRAKLTWQTKLGEITMETTNFRFPIRNLPEHLDRSRITTVLDQIETALTDHGGVYCRTFADSFTITLEVPTHQLMDTASCLRNLNLI